MIWPVSRFRATQEQATAIKTALLDAGVEIIDKKMFKTEIEIGFIEVPFGTITTIFRTWDPATEFLLGDILNNLGFDDFLRRKPKLSSRSR